jgi:hypothetical protein
MRNRLIVVALFMAGTAVNLVQASPIKHFHRVVALDADGRLTIDTHNGSVTVMTWKQPNVQIDARIEADAQSDDPQDVEKTNIKVTGSGSSVRIESDYSALPSHLSWLGVSVSMNSRSNLPLVHYTISMPSTAALDIDEHNSQIVVSGLHNDLTIDGHNGSIQVRDLDGAAKIETHNGTISVAFARFARASSFETHNGDVEVRMPAQSRFDLNAEGHRSRPVSSDFALTVNSADSDVSSRVNGGGPELRFSSHNGTLHLVKQ